MTIKIAYYFSLMSGRPLVIFRGKENIIHSQNVLGLKSTDLNCVTVTQHPRHMKVEFYVWCFKAITHAINCLKQPYVKDIEFVDSLEAGTLNIDTETTLQECEKNIAHKNDVIRELMDGCVTLLPERKGDLDDFVHTSLHVSTLNADAIHEFIFCSCHLFSNLMENITKLNCHVRDTLERMVSLRSRFEDIAQSDAQKNDMADVHFANEVMHIVKEEYTSHISRGIEAYEQEWKDHCESTLSQVATQWESFHLEKMNQDLQNLCTSLTFSQPQACFKIHCLIKECREIGELHAKRSDMKGIELMRRLCTSKLRSGNELLRLTFDELARARGTES